MTIFFLFEKRSLKWFTDALFLILPLNLCQLFFELVTELWAIGNQFW